ncbi:CPBP family intramembrane glutamic endopeptidase [Aurantiacibacter aquimixticola]|uniref:CPBP family intramembrane metalloprotease n=1 Tax=Aurantiacibacter aquimixticola TaxID=1958945 RepID=A0A419RVP3_9SPHN|nr:CPBP family intramembrane glutamic endopeptidase [Aurantiacibacter aquimixticola]RJY09849.1 CPBP family intramembrane metalloprotease [Aurantiacibacter aquimixticola]
MNTESTTPATRDGHVPPTDKARIGWGLLIAQLVTVGLVYVLASGIPIIPSTFAQIQAGVAPEDIEVGSYVMASTVMTSMAAGVFVAWLWLRREGRVREAFDLTRQTSWTKTLLWALGGYVGAFLIFGLGGAAMEAIGLESPDPSLVLDLVTESPVSLAIWIIGVACLAAGLGEELLFRGFLMDRLSRTPGIGGNIWLVLFLQAAIFGLPHLYQGWGGVIVTGMIGFMFGWMRWRLGGSLLPLVIVHAAVNTTSMVLAYGQAVG